MTTTAFAFVVATAMFFIFRQTRWMGVLGVFVLLCINPVLFSALLALAGLGYYFFRLRPGSQVIDRNTQVAASKPFRSAGYVVPVILLASLGVALSTVPLDVAPDMSLARRFAGLRTPHSEETIVLRTPGGLLEVSQLRTIEVIDDRVTHELLGLKIGELNPRIRVPAIYRYHVELAPEWRVLRTDGVYTVIAPPVRPSLPVGVEFSGIERDVSGSWLLQPFKGREDLTRLESTVSDALALKAGSDDYIERQRADARETIREFAMKWLIEQYPWQWIRGRSVRVLFSDEPAGSLAAVGA